MEGDGLRAEDEFLFFLLVSKTIAFLTVGLHS